MKTCIFASIFLMFAMAMNAGSVQAGSLADKLKGKQGLDKKQEQKTEVVELAVARIQVTDRADSLVDETKLGIIAAKTARQACGVKVASHDEIAQAYQTALEDFEDFDDELWTNLYSATKAMFVWLDHDSKKWILSGVVMDLSTPQIHARLLIEKLGNKSKLQQGMKELVNGLCTAMKRVSAEKNDASKKTFLTTTTVKGDLPYNAPERDLIEQYVAYTLSGLGKFNFVGFNDFVLMMHFDQWRDEMGVPPKFVLPTHFEFVSKTQANSVMVKVVSFEPNWQVVVQMIGQPPRVLAEDKMVGNTFESVLEELPKTLKKLVAQSSPGAGQ